MNFFQEIGSLAIATRLRILNDRLAEEAHLIYKDYGYGLKPKWFPVFYLLSKSDRLAITEMSGRIGQSHASVSKIVREMIKGGYAQEEKDEQDARRNLISLTAKSRAITQTIDGQYADVKTAVDDILAGCQHNLWEALGEFEYYLNQQSLANRVMEAKKARTSKNIEIIPYQAQYQKDFRDINVAWIQQYFVMEESDFKALDHPETYILEPGGQILLALDGSEVVGVCALIKMDHPEYDFELAKMGVSPKAQGKGVGFLLGQSILQKAKELGAQKVYLESNTVLGPAIGLYQKLGFKKIVGYPSPYARCNIQMAVELK